MTVRHAITLSVNGSAHEVFIEPHWTLLDVLRREIGLTGTKENCIEAECGVCTILLDGKAVCSCILLAKQAAGHHITTIEGLGTPDELDPMQAAFLKHGAVQCGYCIPGMILTARSFLAEHEGMPTRDDIREAISGTLCRCTGYQKIVDAVADFASSRTPAAA